MSLQIRRLHPASLQGLDASPGHTAGHQCVVVRGAGGAFDLLIGDAAYTPRVYADPASEKLPLGPGQRRAGLAGLGAADPGPGPGPGHFCHHTGIVHR